MEAQYGKFLDMIRVVQINVPLIDVLVGMPNYGKFLMELISNKHDIEQISAAFLSDESSAIIQNKVPPKLGDLGSFLIPCNFNKSFSCTALADLGASINLMPYSLYAKLSFKTFIPTKMSVRLADRSFQYPIGIVENMLVEVEEDFDALLDEGSKILHSIKGTLLEEEIFAEFDEFMAMTVDKNFDSESDTKEPPFEKITINTDYKIKTSLEEPSMNLKLKPLPDNLEYVFLEEPSFFLLSYHLSFLKKRKINFYPSLKSTSKPLLGKRKTYLEVVKKEIMKLLDTGIIYPIADSPWVSPIHCVPKKDGIVLGHKVSSAGLEVDKAKIDVISKLLPPTNTEGIDFMGPFPKSYKFEYIIVVFYYVSKWAEAQALPTNDARVVVTFLKKLFCRFGMPKALISDRGTQFRNKIIEKTMKRYGVNHRFSTSYHPQTSGQVENTNKALKRILEKTVKDNHAIWSRKLDDALWAFRTAYKTPIESTPYKLIYEKNCHLPLKIKHRAYWALKNCNPDLIVAGEKRMFQLHELDELKHQAYENSRLYKERTKAWHDRNLRMRKEFK
nr:reverse transcriptase domain-containing protein [Tanacetum cinerariifolium]